MSEYRPTTEETNDPEEIRRNIEATRAEMGGTIDALQEKLNPDHLKAEVQDAITERVETVKSDVQDAITERVDAVKSQVREATVGRVETMVSNVSDSTRGAGNSMMDTIKANPVPAAMIGLGLGWLIANRGGGTSSTSSPNAYSYDNRYNGGQYAATAQYGERDAASSVGDKIGGVAQSAGDKLGDVTQGAKERVGDLTDAATDRVSTLTDRAQSGAQQAKGTFQQTLGDNPLMVGAVALALGLAAGMALPGTEAENRLLGESRDQLVGQAQAMAQDTFQKVSQVAQDVQGTATQAVKESAERQGLMQPAQ